MDIMYGSGLSVPILVHRITTVRETAASGITWTHRGIGINTFLYLSLSLFNHRSHMLRPNPPTPAVNFSPSNLHLPWLLPLPSTPMYEATLNTIPPPFSALLTSYSSIAPPAQIAHVLSLRNRAYASHPYPCLGRFRFMDLDLSNHPLYGHILARLKSPDEDTLLLDLGCCLGQDIRQLLLDGAPGSKVYGADLLPEFIEAGYDLFGDRATFPADHFVVPADGFDVSPGNALAVFDGRVSILHISAVFHLFGLERQKVLARRCLRLLDRGKGGKCWILGGQTANVKAGEYPRGDRGMRWRHSAESWRVMWEGVAEEEGGCEVKCHSVLEERDGSGVGRRKIIGEMEEGFRWMVWWVEVTFGV
jgi:hypothetical protein